MAQGKIKRVANIDQKFGANESYLFLKVEAHGRGEEGEEYWLLTDDECEKFRYRAGRNATDVPTHTKRGVFVRVANRDPSPTADKWYIAVRALLVGEPSTPVDLMLTEEELERVRQRVESNLEDIMANKEGWLADLFD